MHIKNLVAIAVMAATVGASDGAFAHAKSMPVSSSSEARRVHYRTVVVDGIKIFYREAGDASKPTILLLHGFPSSSSMFRELLPRLASDFHLIAPDYPGFGNSEAPQQEKFDPTFENLTKVMDDFVGQIGLSQYIVYMQDFGGPVGFRLAVKHPERVKGLIIQNANAYLEGIAPTTLAGMKARVGTLSSEQKAEVDKLVTRDSVLFNYQTGARDPSVLNPDAWNLDSYVLQSPEARRIQAGLIINYYTNLDEYPEWHEFLKKNQPRTLIVWGTGDKIFLPSGAEAYKRDVPKAELHFYNTSHFALEEDGLAIADEIKRFYHGGK